MANTKLQMVDITGKEVTEREAVVEGIVSLKPEVILAIKKENVPKGNVLEAARLAGILAAKHTPFIIPLCHPIPIEYARIDFSITKTQIKVISLVRAKAKTGVEMEALTAASIACLAIYDMCKPLDKDIIISGIRLIKKTGGKSGTYEKK